MPPHSGAKAKSRFKSLRVHGFMRNCLVAANTQNHNFEQLKANISLIKCRDINAKQEFEDGFVGVGVEGL